MIFDGITLHNYGVYLGSQKIQLRPENAKKPIILFGGLNGVGKTTLLDAFQLALYGKLASCSSRGSLSYEKYLRRSIHKSVSINEGAAITIDFRHKANGTEHSYQITRAWRQHKKTFTEDVLVVRDGKTDMVLTESWNEYVEQFIPNRIANLFFFDGEKIKDLADFERSAEILSTGINQLLGLDLVDRLVSDLVVLEKKKAQDLSVKHEQKRVRFLEEKVIELGTKRDELLQQCSEAQNRVDEITKKITVIDERFRLEGGDLYRERGALEAKRRDAQASADEIKEKLLDTAGSELPLLLVEPLLERVLTQSMLEKEAASNDELAEAFKRRDEAIIYHLKKKVDGDVVKEIEKFLRRDIQGRASARATETYLGLESDTTDAIKELLHGSLIQTSTEAHKLIDEYNNQLVLIEDVDRKLTQVPDAEAIIAILEQKTAMESERSKAQIRCDIIEKELAETKRSMAVATNELEKEYLQRLDADHSRETAARIITHSKKSRETLVSFKERVVEYHLDRIQKFVIASFKKLLRKETLVTDIRFDPKTYRLEAYGSGRKKVHVERLSAGEKQLLSVSLLWGLARASGRRLPAIIDTPLGRLDTTHRIHLVERYFPRASHQVLLLSTDEEINEKYYRMIEPWVSQAYRLEYDDSNQTTTIKPGYFW